MKERKVFYGVLLAMVAAEGLASAQTMAPSPSCLVCRPGQQPVDVSILVGTEEDYNNFFNGYYMAESWYRVAPGTVDGGTHWVTDETGIRGSILRHASACQRVKYLAIFTHGAPGEAAFGRSSLNSQNAGQILQGLDCAMADNARVEFGGCNVGRGCRGEDFLAQIAANLLRRGGGSVRGATNYSTTIMPGWIPHTSINLDTQILTVGAGLTSPRWDNTPQTGAQCVTRVTDAIADLEHMSRQAGSCSAVSGTDADSIRTFLADFRAVLPVQQSLGSSRLGFDSTHATAAGEFWRVFANYQYIKNRVDSQIAGCVRSQNLVDRFERGERLGGGTHVF